MRGRKKQNIPTKTKESEGMVKRKTIKGKRI